MKSDKTAMPVPTAFTGPRKYGELRMMNSGDYQGVYSEVFNVCRDAFEKQGHFSATAFILQVNERGQIGLAYPAAMGELFQQQGARGKELAARYMNYMIEFDAVDFVVLVTEAWRAPIEAGKEGRSPALHPYRSEVLMFNIMSKDCQALAACGLTRDPQTDVATVADKVSLEFIHPDLNQFEGVFVRHRETVLN